MTTDQPPPSWRLADRTRPVFSLRAGVAISNACPCNASITGRPFTRRVELESDGSTKLLPAVTRLPRPWFRARQAAKQASYISAVGASSPSARAGRTRRSSYLPITVHGPDTTGTTTDVTRLDSGRRTRNRPAALGNKNYSFTQLWLRAVVQALRDT